MKMNFYLAFYVLFIQILVVRLLIIDWLNNTKMLRNRIKKFYSSTFISKNDSVSVGPRPFGLIDYPGNDSKKLDLVEQIFKEYNNCLETKARSMEIKKIMSPRAVAVFSGMSTQLDCAVCISPEDINSKAEWYIATRSRDPVSVMVEEDEYKQIAAYSSKLQFFNIQRYHEGIYTCKLKSDFGIPYFLHIFTSDVEPTIEVNPRTAQTGPFTKDPLQITKTKIVLWHEWSDWTKCSYCGIVGKKSKIGYCKIILFQNLATDVQEKVVESNTQHDIPVNIIEETENLLQIFINGIPCRSTLLPTEILNHKIIRKFPSQILTAFCKEPCPKDLIVEVINKDGNVVETYNNTAGEYYAHQDLPRSAENPERITSYADRGKPFIISCPSIQHINSPVEWSVNGKIWFKKASGVELISNNRVMLNDLNEIIIRQVEEEDAKIYSCYKNRELVGVVRLLLNDPPTYLEPYVLTVQLYPTVMILTIIITLIYTSTKMCLNRHKAKIGAIVTRKPKRRLVELIKDAYHDKYTKPPNSIPTRTFKKQ